MRLLAIALVVVLAGCMFAQESAPPMEREAAFTLARAAYNCGRFETNLPKNLQSACSVLRKQIGITEPRADQ